MERCNKCGSSLISNGFCHECNCYTSYGKDETNNNFSCKVCEKKFHYIDKYKSHIKSHPQCFYCKKRFKSKAEVKSHEKKHQCHVCGSYFYPIGQHLSHAHFFCEICNKWFIDKKSYGKHNLNHPQCDYCGKRFESKSKLNGHLEYVHKCSICNDYVKDVSLHIDADHIFCSICNKYFKDTQDYKNYHSAYKLSAEDLKGTSLTKYKDHLYCSDCNKYFANLKKYGDKYPKCKYCGIRIERKNHDLHVSSHKCPLCENYYHPLESHMSEMHFYSNNLDVWFLNETIYSNIHEYLTEGQCDICYEKLDTMKDLIRHLRNKHPDSYESDIYKNYVLKKIYFKGIPSINPSDFIKKLGYTKGKKYAEKLAFLASKYRF